MMTSGSAELISSMCPSIWIFPFDFAFISAIVTRSVTRSVEGVSEALDVCMVHLQIWNSDIHSFVRSLPYLLESIAFARTVFFFFFTIALSAWTALSRRFRLHRAGTRLYHTPRCATVWELPPSQVLILGYLILIKTLRIRLGFHVLTRWLLSCWWCASESRRKFYQRAPARSAASLLLATRSSQPLQVRESTAGMDDACSAS